MSEHDTELTEDEAAVLAELTPDASDPVQNDDDQQTDETPDDPEPDPELDEAGDDDDDDAGDSHEAPQSEIDAQKLIASLNAYQTRAMKYLAKNMGEVLGDDATSYSECPFCNYTNTPGFLHVSPCPPELLGTVYEWANMRPPSQLKSDEHSQKCSECDGEGVVATGSKVAGQESLACIRCTGKGWTATDEKRQSSSMYVPNGMAPATAVPAADASGALNPDGEEPPEAAALRARGFIVIQPIGSGA